MLRYVIGSSVNSSAHVLGQKHSPCQEKMRVGCYIWIFENILLNIFKLLNFLNNTYSECNNFVNKCFERELIIKRLKKNLKKNCK